MDAIIPVLSDVPVLNTRASLTVVLALCLGPLCLPNSLAGTSVLYTSWISVATFVAWLISMAYAHAKGMRIDSPSSESLGILWQGISEFCMFLF